MELLVLQCTQKMKVKMTNSVGPDQTAPLGAV